MVPPKKHSFFVIFIVWALLLTSIWIVWGIAIHYAALQIDNNILNAPDSLPRVAEYATAIGILASFITSFTIIIAAIQLKQNNEEIRHIMQSLEASSHAQNLISRSHQIDLLFDGYMASFVRELESGIELWGEKAASMHGMRNILENKWRTRREDSSDYQQYLAALTAEDIAMSDKQLAFRRAADALSLELELMGVKCLTGAVPTGVLLAEMGGHWALQWLLCSPWAHARWHDSSNRKAIAAPTDETINIHFSRRHGFWLAIMSALYARKEWPDGEYANWADQLLQQEFGGQIDLARAHVLAIYDCDKQYFGANAECEKLMVGL